MNAKVDAYFNGLEKWREELAKLRSILLECTLTEELKWGKPCYAFNKSNLVILYALKESCALGFLKGALLKDPHGILIMPGENSQSGRWVKFTSVQEIVAKKSVLKAYIHEAIAAEKAGLKVNFKTITEHKVPEELQEKLDEIPALKKAFAALTPGRKRAYYIFISAAKQSATRASRVENCQERILKVKGLNDCVCGRSKKYPACDGSHKFIGRKPA